LPSATDPAAIKRDFGDRVRGLRKQAGLSQEELARRADLHPTYVSGIERGQRNVSLVNIHAIAAALAVPVTVLFEARRSRTG
jgi:transcriptional regulator with XRE-family HTH domain